MSVCWEQDPLFRPTAAQIRMVASCPQFCHLADAVSMETQAVVLSACSISGCDSISGSVWMLKLPLKFATVIFIPPQTLFVVGILFSRCPSVRSSVLACVGPSVTFCILNNSKSHCWIFIKPCKHVHLCKTNTLDKKVRARGQFYKSYFPL